MMLYNLVISLYVLCLTTIYIPATLNLLPTAVKSRTVADVYSLRRKLFSMQLVETRDQWRVLVNKTMNLWAP
jgi:predicted membrane chloride channel (bestrophin family)